jgi:hypothetical protein
MKKLFKGHKLYLTAALKLMSIKNREIKNRAIMMCS